MEMETRMENLNGERKEQAPPRPHLATAPSHVILHAVIEKIKYVLGDATL